VNTFTAYIVKIKDGATSYIRAKEGTLISSPGSLDFQLQMRGMSVEDSGSAARHAPRTVGTDESSLQFSLAQLQEDTVRINASMKSTPALSQEVSSGKDCFTGAELTPVQKSLSNTELNKRYSFSLASIMGGTPHLKSLLSHTPIHSLSPTFPPSSPSLLLAIETN
jgi:lipopolysaccharide export system permease protein